MKKLIKGALFLAIVGTVIVGCEKEDSPILEETDYTIMV